MAQEHDVTRCAMAHHICRQRELVPAKIF